VPSSANLGPKILSKIFSLQRLMGHQDITILRRYLAETTDDISIAHAKGSPVENYSWG
jgi:hypothetical protein